MPRRSLMLVALSGFLAITIALFSIGMISATSAVASPTTQPVAASPATALSSGPQVPGGIAAEAVAAAYTMNNPMFTCIRWAESNDRYELVSGAYGILISSWQAYESVWHWFGDYPTPGQAPKQVQDLVAYHLYRVGGGYGGWHDYCTGRA